MTRFDSLRRRIVRAHVLLALGGCLFFAILAAITVEGIEEYLVDDRLESVAAWASPRQAAGLPVEMPAGLSFYRGNDIPTALRKMPKGVHEIYINGNELHVLTGKDAYGDYAVVDHASEYDKIEWVVYTMIGVGLLGFLILSLLMGRFLAQRVVTPITALSTAVRQPDGSTPLPLLDSPDELGDLARAFSARTEELQRFLTRERFFTGDVSHELRTPLTVIIGAAEIIKSQAGQPTVQAAAERILRTTTEAAECVTVLLLLARAPEQIDTPATRLSDVVQGEIARDRFLLAGKPVTLESRIEADFSVGARRELLAAAIGNLIRNACLYTSEGHVRVTVRRPCISVEDTGPGVPPAVQALLMNGTQTDALTGAAGTGLGLALVRRICEQLGARLTLTESPAGGSIFTLDFSANLTET